jgi:hypothetical protein
LNFLKRKGTAILYWFAALVLSTVIWQVPTRAQSQTMPATDQDNDLTRQQLAAFDQFLDSHPELAEQVRKSPSVINNEEFVEGHPDLQGYLQQHPEVREDVAQNPNAVMNQEQRFDRHEDRDRDRDHVADNDHDINRTELANMDRFMDSHPEIAEQLRKNPSLATNEEFVENHPALQQFLASHPGVREEVKENPDFFMNREQRFDVREDSHDRDITRGELANMDRFLDSHPEIAEQLRKNPSLASNEEFVKSHPELQQFLAAHPGVREEIRENPNVFVSREQRFDAREDSRDRDVTRGELANMDRFLDSHPEVAEQLRKNPDLVNNKEFVEGHPALREFLASHPGVREEYKEHPDSFMHQEQRFDRAQDNFEHRDRDVTRGELSSFHEFLEDHNRISGELSKDPSLATNEEYLENHPELRQYLKTNPKVKEELGENPQSFVKSARQFERPNKAMPKPLAESKMK